MFILIGMYEGIEKEIARQNAIALFCHHDEELIEAMKIGGFKIPFKLLN